MNNRALSDLLAQKAALEKQIEEVQREARANAIAQVKTMMAEYGLTLADIGTRGAPPAKKPAAKVAAKYRDPVSGQTWSGRGLKPKWLAAALAQGRSITDFVV